MESFTRSTTAVTVSLPSQETPPLLHSRITFNCLFLIQHRKVSDHPIPYSVYTLFIIREIVGIDKYFHWNVQKEIIHSADTARKCCEWWEAKRNQLQCVGIKLSSVLPQEEKKEKKTDLGATAEGNRTPETWGNVWSLNLPQILERNLSFLNWEIFSVVATDYLEDSYLF